MLLLAAIYGGGLTRLAAEQKMRDPDSSKPSSRSRYMTLSSDHKANYPMKGSSPVIRINGRCYALTFGDMILLHGTHRWPRCNRFTMRLFVRPLSFFGSYAIPSGRP